MTPTDLQQTGEPFDEARAVGLSGVHGIFNWRMSVVVPFQCEEERQEFLELIDLFRRMVARAPLAKYPTKKGNP